MRHSEVSTRFFILPDLTRTCDCFTFAVVGVHSLRKRERSEPERHEHVTRPRTPTALQQYRDCSTGHLDLLLSPSVLASVPSLSASPDLFLLL